MTRWLAALGVVVIAGAGCDINSVLEQVSESRQLAANLQTHFTKYGDAGNRAVMADTDEQSLAFAREAEQAAQAVQTDIEMLVPLLRTLSYPEEGRLLDRFRQQFIEYRALDKTVLELAVQQTNVKAQRLSLGAAQDAADACRDALEAVRPARPSDQWQLKALVATAVASVREVQVLQARHIPEADDAAMDRLETRMAAEDAAAREAIATIGALAGASSRSRVVEATVAVNRLGAVNGEIRSLSRRNSNVRALAMSLEQKRGLALRGEETLLALRDALAKRGFTGTR